VVRCESIASEALSSAAGEDAAGISAVLERMLPAVPRNARVVLIPPPHVILLKQMRTPRVSAAKSRQVLEFAVAQAWPQAAGEMVWDAIGSAIAGEEMDHLVIAAKLSGLVPWCQAIQRARLELSAVVPSILALRAAEAASSRVSRRLLVEAGARAATFLQADGERFAARSLGTVATGSGDEIARLAQEATRTSLHFHRQNGWANPELIVLVAEPEWDESRVARLGEMAKLPVESLRPVREPAVPKGAESVPRATWARMQGGALVASGRHGPAAMLIPETVREQRRRRRKRAWLAAAVVLAATALLPPILTLRRESAVRQRQCETLEKSLAPLLARSQRMQERHREIARLREELELLDAIAQRRTAWFELLGGLQERLSRVGEVWLERMQAVAAENEAPVRIVIDGCLLDRGEPPVAERMKAVVRELRTIPAVAAIEAERFDSSQPHLLRFELVLVISATHPL
jgi:hypothetical protein